ncbi:MAG TPA: hypothetical protein VNA12_02850 [Mycobacteriales bacterium]|nr:hypothetical protein [Mycobacteriales bacterium]
MVFVGLDGPAAPWDRADEAVLRQAWEALSQIDAPRAADLAVTPSARLPGDAAPPPPPVLAALAPPAPPAEEHLPAVRLTFADGFELNLPLDDPAAIALRAVADRLVAVGADR